MTIRVAVLNASVPLWTPTLPSWTVEEEVAIGLTVAVALHAALSGVAKQPAVADHVAVVCRGGVLGLCFNTKRSQQEDQGTENMLKVSLCKSYH